MTMLSRTADHLYWMSRYMERAENTARMLDVNYQTSLLTQGADASGDGWRGLLSISELTGLFSQRHERIDAASVMDFMVRDEDNLSSIWNCLRAARENARAVRGALTTEVWETTNQTWIEFNRLLKDDSFERDPGMLFEWVKFRSHLSRGVTLGTMLQDEALHFLRIGTFLERADNTARILDVKYYVLLPSAFRAGSSLDNVQWETILRSVSAQRAYRWLNAGDSNPVGIASFLILDARMPRSFAFCYSKICDNLGYLAEDYGERLASHEMADAIRNRLRTRSIESIFDSGLHEFLLEFIRDNNALGRQIEEDYRFNG